MEQIYSIFIGYYSYLSPGLPRPVRLNIIGHKYSYIKFNRAFKHHYEKSDAPVDPGSKRTQKAGR